MVLLLQVISFSEGEIMDREFNISLQSSYKELWRYNIVISCGCFNEANEQIDFLSAEQFVAPVGANLTSAPDGVDLSSKVALLTKPCDHIVIYLYFVPHTLPPTRDVEEYEPFDAQVRVSTSQGDVYNAPHKINQWSGASIELKLPQSN